MPDSANVERRGRTWVEALRESMKSMAERIVSQGGDGSVGTGVAEEGQMIQTDKGTGIVELEAGGWSFAARDMDGLVWVWGECSVWSVDVAAQENGQAVLTPRSTRRDRV